VKHLVNVSGGNGSGMALLRVIDRYGRENVSARLADTNSEHPDLYRFVDDLERVAGIKIERLNNGGRNIWDVFFAEMMFTNPKTGGCLASWHLKRLPLQGHAAWVGTPETVTIHVGFSIDEDDRIERLKKASDPWQFDFPLTWPKPMLRCDVEDELRRRGIKPCEIYDKGYPHSNCLKWNCILSGIGQWIGVLKDNPAGYLDAEEKEQQFMAELERRGRKVQTILRDRRGGVTQNLSLRQLREEVEAGVRHKYPEWRESTCTCIGDLF
jgi:hypothetical protein